VLYQIGPRIDVSFFCFVFCLFAIMSTFASAFAALMEAVSGCDPVPNEESHQVCNSDCQRLAAAETGLVLLTEQVTALAQSVVCTDTFQIDNCRSVNRASVSAALHERTPVSLHSLPEDNAYRPCLRGFVNQPVAVQGTNVWERLFQQRRVHRLKHLPRALVVQLSLFGQLSAERMSARHPSC
jgi:hypothetical protein